MIAASSMFRPFSLFVVLALLVNKSHCLDLEFDSIECDTSLPAYIYPDKASMTCNGGEKRCTFGSSVMITGTMQYEKLYLYAYNSTGCVSANLKLLSVEYSLFKNLPFNFCGSWVTPNEYNKYECPHDGVYHFSVPYDLPWDDQDITTWVATGWQGTTDLAIYTNSSESAMTLASCKLHWKTYVTQSAEDGWQTLPSAAQAAIILASILAAMFLCCTYLTCCRYRNRNDAVMDVIETTTKEREAKSGFKKMDDQSDEKTKKNDQIHRINVKLKNPDWA